MLQTSLASSLSLLLLSFLPSSLFLLSFLPSFLSLLIYLGSCCFEPENLIKPAVSEKNLNLLSKNLGEESEKWPKVPKSWAERWLELDSQGDRRAIYKDIRLKRGGSQPPMHRPFTRAALYESTGRWGHPQIPWVRNCREGVKTCVFGGGGAKKPKKLSRWLR